MSHQIRYGLCISSRCWGNLPHSQKFRMKPQRKKMCKKIGSLALIAGMMLIGLEGVHAQGYGPPVGYPSRQIPTYRNVPQNGFIPSGYRSNSWTTPVSRNGGLINPLTNNPCSGSDCQNNNCGSCPSNGCGSSCGNGQCGAGTIGTWKAPAHWGAGQNFGPAMNHSYSRNVYTPNTNGQYLRGSSSLYYR